MTNSAVKSGEFVAWETIIVEFIVILINIPHNMSSSWNTFVYQVTIFEFAESSSTLTVIVSFSTSWNWGFNILYQIITLAINHKSSQHKPTQLPCTQENIYFFSICDSSASYDVVISWKIPFSFLCPDSGPWGKIAVIAMGLIVSKAFLLCNSLAANILCEYLALGWKWAVVNFDSNYYPTFIFHI